MKKIYTFGAIALAALATLSCNQEVFVDVNPSVSGGLTEIYVTREANGTKTTWRDSNNPSVIVWGANDQLSVFSTDNPEQLQNLCFYTTSEAYTAYAQTWGTLTFTHGSAVPGTAPYWSIFPYNRSNAMVNGHPQFPFMYNQTARANYFDPQAFAAASYSENMNFNFRNLFGLLEIKVGEMNVTSVTLKSNKQGDAFGSVYTVLGFAGELYANPNDSNVEEITLTPDDGTFTVGETYYMVVPPKEFSEGATFTLYNGSTKVAELSTSGAVSVERNKVHSVPVLTESEPTVGPGNTVAEIVAQITSADKDNPSAYSVDNLAGAVVSYVNGNNAYIEDKSGAILLYLADNGLAAGDIISGALSGTGYLYNGLPEITSIGNAYIKTTGGTIPETTITLAELSANHAANLSRRVLVKGVTVTDGIKNGDRNGIISQGAGVEYPVYAQLNNKGLTLNAGDIGDMVLFVGVYNTTNQLLFWDNNFFTQTGAVTNLTVTESLSVSAGSTKSISVETNSTGAVSFASNKPSVAAVDDKGVVTGVSEGTAEITVSVAADGFYEAISKVCAVTVTAASGDKEEYVLTFSGATNQKSVNNYTSSWEAICDGFTWTVENFNNNTNKWAYVKCGSKNAASIGTITTKNAIPGSISKVTVTIDAITADSVNSIKLLVDTDSSFASAQAFDIDKSKGDKEVTITSPVKNAYYKLSFDCAKGSANGLVQVSKVVYTK